MRCRYCNQRLNLFKSLSGSSFCSQEHQKLYEEAEANKGLERLLQFVEKVPKPGPGKPAQAPAAKVEEKPVQLSSSVPAAASVPPPAPIPQTIAAKSPDTSPEHPVAGFLLDRIAPAAGSSAGVNANFEIIVSGFPAGPAAFPSFKFEIAATDLRAPAEEPPSQASAEEPPPLASWSNTGPLALDVAALSVELPSVGSIRPRAPACAMPAPDNKPLALEGRPLLPVSDAPGLQLAPQAAFDTDGFPNLARLIPLPQEVRAPVERTQLPAAKSDGAVLPSPGALESRLAPQAVFDAEGFPNLARLNPLPREVRAPVERTQLSAAKSDGAVLPSPGALESRLPPKAVFDTEGFPNLARLNPLAWEARAAAGAITQLPAAKTDVVVLPSPGALELNKLQVKQSAAVAIGTSAAMTRTALGRKVSAPQAPAPQLLAKLRSSGARSTFPKSVQEALGIDRPAVLSVRLESKAAPAPASYSRASQFLPVAAGLQPQAFATLKVEQCNRAPSIDMQGAMTRTGVAKAVSQPEAQEFELLNMLRSIEILNRVFADVQNTTNPADFPISLAICAQREPAVPLFESAPAKFAAVVAPAVTPRNLAIRESDTARAVGIIDTHKPVDILSPLLTPAVLSSRNSLTIGISRTAREIPAQIQAQQGSRNCTISLASERPRDCLLPAIFWSSETWLRSAIACAGWFAESDCGVEAFPSAAPAPRVFSVRFEPEPFFQDLPALAWDQTVRRLAIEVCESTAKFAGGEPEAQRLASLKPSRTSPSKLVAKPKPLVSRLAVRYVVKLNPFTSIVNRAASGVAPRSSVSPSADEHQPLVALPRIPSSGCSAAVCLFSPAALQPPRIEAADQRNTEARSRPHPSPLRNQPASMLVLPGLSLRHSGIVWRASRWAKVAVMSLAKQGNVQVSSSEETDLLSLRSLQEALRIDPGSIRAAAALRLSPKPPAILLDLDAGTSNPGVPSANALPRRRGPRLPGVSSQPVGLIEAGG